MLEREKQRSDQQKKHASEKQRQEDAGKEQKVQPSEQQAGKATDPSTTHDEGYIERMNEKTQKH